MIENIMNDATMNMSTEKKETLAYVAKSLDDAGFETAFIAGVLGNVYGEGTYGLFEGSNYSSNPSAKPQYLVYMDEHYNYSEEFSYKNISVVGVRKTFEVLLELEKGGYEGKFGLGSVQWTGSRTMDLVKTYIEVCGIDGYPTSEQMLRAESMLIVDELNGDYNYIYQQWLNDYSGKEGAAYNAGSLITLKYERPVNMEAKAVTRGGYSESLYNIMMGK